MSKKNKNMNLSIDATIQIAVTLVAIGATWGSLNGSIGYLRSAVDSEIKPDLKNLRERFIVVEEKVNTLWKDRAAPQGSPRTLNALGIKILNESGIKEIVDRKKEYLITLVKERAPKTAYDTDQCIADVMMELPIRCPGIVDTLKEGAFRTGADIDTVLFVGSVYLSKLIFSELGFTARSSS